MLQRQGTAIIPTFVLEKNLPLRSASMVTGSAAGAEDPGSNTAWV
jgi:hypothetical protein